MASFEMAFEYMIRHEDAKLAGIVTEEPHGAKARFGINSLAHPEAVRDGFYEMERGAALGYASNIYRRKYFEPIGGFQINDPIIADKYFDLAVNVGTVQATKIVQRAINSLLRGPALVMVDGKAGMRTIDAINQSMPSDLLAAIRSYGKQFYQDVARRQPEEETFLDDWLKRLDS